MGKDIRKIISEVLNEIDWEDTFGDVKQSCIAPKDVVDYLNRVRANAPLKTKDREKFKADKPFVHAKSSFFDSKQDVVDIDHFIAKMTQPPLNVINTNEKILKSGGPHEYVYKTGIPAFRGIAYDESTGKFHYINTCPGAGSCAVICYALKGRYIQYPASHDSMTRRLNFLLNHPEEYEMQMYNELKAKAKEYKALEGYKSRVILRWNDSGDFFAKKYTDIAENVMSRLKAEGYNVDSYAYTKVAGVANDSNLDTTFSSGANKRQSSQMGAGHKSALVVPKALFKDLDLMRVDDEKKLKARVAEFFKLDPKDVITYDDLMSTPKDGPAKWNVIVTPNDGDDAAFRGDVKSILLTQH